MATPMVRAKTQAEEEETVDIVLTTPLSFQWESNLDHEAPNLLQRILSLFKNVSPGSDITRFQLPPLFNIPKSHLQCYGESVYSTSSDLLSKCAAGESPLERMTCVVAWSISTTRPLSFGLAPYNPILGETHHVSRGTLNVLLEQVSHHPPVSALHATDETNNIELVWCQCPVPRFHGTTIETEVQGKRRLYLAGRGESYVMNSPNLSIKLFPVPSVEWVGKVGIKCPESGLEAEICYKGSSFLSLGGGKKTVTGKIFDSSVSKTLYEIDGRWDRTISLKDVSNGKVKILYYAKETLSRLRTPILLDQQGVRQSESARVWAKVSRGILSKDWDRAREAKTVVEERERKLLRQRNSIGVTWKPQHFKISYSKQDGWDCSPIEKNVPPSPIIYSV
ncbi:hypothetical protein Drorol1_Dr00005703 [Drosera rotundifolia]